MIVADDGVGLPPVTVRSGLANLADRAARLGGALTLGSSPGGGALVTWDVPLRPEPDRPSRSAGLADT